jgi:hypothetical protein
MRQPTRSNRKPPVFVRYPVCAEPLPPLQEALNQPFRAFPSWFLRIECDPCGKVLMQTSRTSPVAG